MAMEKDLNDCGHALGYMLQGKIAAEQRAMKWELKHRALMEKYVAMKRKANTYKNLPRLEHGVSNRVAAFEKKKKKR